MMNDESDFKLESPPTFITPVVGDRYVYREKCVEIIEVSATHVTLKVAYLHESFLKKLAVEEFWRLEKRTLRMGALFKPASVPTGKVKGMCGV